VKKDGRTPCPCGGLFGVLGDKDQELFAWHEVTTIEERWVEWLVRGDGSCDNLAKINACSNNLLRCRLYIAALPERYYGSITQLPTVAF
jgi:hypothetical protein